MGNFLIYGAYGYTGELIARESVRRGHQPVLAGRDAQQLETLAAELGVESRAVALDDPAKLDQVLGSFDAVVHCAGPFSHTSRQMVDACLRTQTHYFDITGEVDVFEAIAARDEEARQAGVMLLPGIGFDVVPTDCLAAYLHGRLPSATHLTLAFQAIGRLSRGTATTMLENFPHGGAVRQNGEITRVPAAWRTREIDFGDGPVKAITIPWGDVSTAYYSTGIPNIEVYMAAPLGMRVASRLSRNLGGLIGAGPVQSLLKNRIRSGSRGPSERQREAGRSHLWGEVRDEAGNSATARLHTPEGYQLTMLTAVAGVERAVSGEAPPGFQTPSKAYEAEFVMGIPGVQREDV